MKKTIEIIVSPQGETRIETKGFTGAECRLASRFLEVALGRRIAEQVTPEFHQNQSTDQVTEQST
jgi:hypothetical protein